MLTKDLLRVRNRGGKVTPEFVPVSAAAELSAATDLLNCAKTAVGFPLGETRTALADLCHGGVKCAPGLAKLVMDRMEIEEPDPDIAVSRLEMIRQARFLREKCSTRKEFEELTGRAFGQEFKDLGSRIYSDLTDSLGIKSFDPIEPEMLIQRYNTALVQGLMLQADSVLVKVKKLTLSERRRLFRALRFHRLTPGISSERDVLSLDLGGPLSLFGVAGVYGMCIANFIPHIFSFEHWEIGAAIVTRKGQQKLSLNENSGLISHYREKTPWIPEEFSAFANSFSKRFTDWIIEPSGEPLILGEGIWSIPDFTFRSPSGKILHMELFHRWHAGALVARVKKLSESPRKDLVLGVCRKLAKSGEVAKVLDKFEFFKRHGVLFNDFPTPMATMAILKELAD